MIEIDEFARDAAWFCDGSGWTFVTTVEGKPAGRYVEIHCSGLMQIRNNDTGEVIRTAQDLRVFGWRDDSDLVAVDQEPGPWEWISNPWFELSENGQALGLVAHDLLDAIEDARAYLRGDMR